MMDDTSPPPGARITRRRFTVMAGKVAVGATGLLGGLVSFTPTKRAFGQFVAPPGFCAPFVFSAGATCVGACTTVDYGSCCAFATGPSSQAVCCVPGDIKYAAPLQMVFTCSPTTDGIDFFCIGCCPLC